jgi:hypothetical protein
VKRSYAIGGMHIAVDASARMCAALDVQMVAFHGHGAPAMSLAVEERAPLAPGEDEAEATAELSLEGDVVSVRARSGEGRFDLRRRAGAVSASGLGVVDALMRAALSLTLPQEGALLLHGALVAHPEGDASAYLGASGAGKSTVARATGGACDELVIARVSPHGVSLFATPYWRGRPFSAPARAFVHLRRGIPIWRRLGGSAALRALFENTIRYLNHEPSERAIFALCAHASLKTPVVEASCPTGDAFLPFVLGAMS